MQKELGMNAINNAYTIVSLVFFFTYAACQPPATMAIRKFGPRIFLTLIVFGWGVVTIVSRASSPVHGVTNEYRASASSTPGR